MNSKTTITISDFGVGSSGEKIKLFTLKRSDGLMAKIINFGAIITELHVPDMRGAYKDVLLGFKNLDSYMNENTYAGAIVGRIAGRVRNASFTIKEDVYHITKNEGSHHVHGGSIGLDKKIWEYKIIDISEGKALQLSVFSPDGEEGYPGNVTVTVIYSLTNENGIKIEFGAITDKATPICLTNHAYFNLSGEKNIKNHSIQIKAGKVVVLDKEFIPTGKVDSVVKGDNDFRDSVRLGDRLEILKRSHGENYLLDNVSKKPKKVAQVTCEGRTMEVHTTAPCLQVYTASALKTRSNGKNGIPYSEYAGLCLECQGFSDALNHVNFKSIVLQPKDTFQQITEYRFTNSN